MLKSAVCRARHRRIQRGNGRNGILPARRGPAAERARNRHTGFGSVATMSMTLRYMHLAPSALREAIGLLDFGQPLGSNEQATARSR